MSQEEDFFNSENPNTDPPEEQEMPEPDKSGKGGSRRRVLLLVLLLLVIVAGALFYLGPGLLEPEIAQTPAPPPKKDVVKLSPPDSADEVQELEKGKSASEKKVKKEEIPERSVIAVEKIERPANESSAATAKEPAAEEETAPAEPVDEAVAVTGGQKGDYALQVGAFLLDSNLRSAEAAVKTLGYETRHTEESGKVEMTRLKVGSFDEETARAKLEDISSLAPDAFITKKDGKVNLYAGSYYSLDRARAFADRLYAQGVRVEEKSVEVELPITIVRFGAFEDRSEAERVASRARDRGLDVTVVERR